MLNVYNNEWGGHGKKRIVGNDRGLKRLIDGRATLIMAKAANERASEDNV